MSGHDGGVCEGLRQALDAHLPGCPVCREARRMVSEAILHGDRLSFPCPQGLELINAHLENCSRCMSQARQSLQAFAELLRAMTGPTP